MTPRTGETAGAGPVRPAARPPGRPAELEVRLAGCAAEVREAQRLRYRVFYAGGAATPSAVARLSRRDCDRFDAVCDHLLVLDHAVGPRPFRSRRPKVVGTYRLLRRAVAEASGGGFYSAGEFDLAPLLAARADLDLLELGRSCVLPTHRSRRAVELLWAGVWAYAVRHRVEAMIGCASLPGTEPRRLTVPLSFLHHHAAASEPWRVRPLPGRAVAVDLLAREAVEPRSAFRALPPLLKGYLRLGASVGDGAVVDPAFGTTDVFVAMPVAAIRTRYLGYFGSASGGTGAARGDPAAIARRPSR